jgi:putative PIN family toxin of toxin-antitoxin system
MGKIKVRAVVIDTNVVVSALLFGGAPGELIPLWKEGNIQPKASKEIIEEYIKVLAYQKFNLSEDEINFLLYHEILPYFEVVRVSSGRVIISDDPSDDIFIRCAKSGKASIVISGDQHLLSLKSYGKIKILTPAEFLKTI